ncbi:cytochrome c oxidase subunit 2A [Caldibacillus debilis]|jgi:hypothetical protein|uniref:Cytochrome c oxidase subunit 2A n=1 Tax=Caldibacillus debilis GB1 TaxID=1339248 RepID=A0A420VET8_9BACI|nr:cytochrome c oxidase subunit 2A [Caldibacillus debilis]RKO62187.1 hypothetical protein Cdeb_00922 [Caldibacillus debilis GB1]
MAKAALQNDTEKKKWKDAEESGNLKGTFVAVMTMGVLIIAAWLGVFQLFLNRP